MEVQARTLEEKLNTTTIIYLLLHDQISYTNRIPYFPSLIEIKKNWQKENTHKGISQGLLEGQQYW